MSRTIRRRREVSIVGSGVKTGSVALFCFARLMSGLLVLVVTCSVHLYSDGAWAKVAMLDGHG